MQSRQPLGCDFAPRSVGTKLQASELLNEMLYGWVDVVELNFQAAHVSP